MKINYIKFFMFQIEMLEKALNNEQMGRLFFAIGHYAMTGKSEDVDADISFQYDIYRQYIDKIRMSKAGQAEKAVC